MDRDSIACIVILLLLLALAWLATSCKPNSLQAKQTQQLDPQGCGVACVARLAGEPYYATRYRWIRLGGTEESLRSEGLSLDQVRVLMQASGLDESRLVKAPCIVALPCGHMVAVDKDGKVFDPGRDAK